MPNMFGGDQLDPDYAPWAWIGKHFVWNTAKEVDYRGRTYRIGVTEEGKVVCERERKDGFYVMVPSDRIPENVKKELEGVTFEGKKQEVLDIAREIEPSLSEKQILQSKHLERR